MYSFLVSKKPVLLQRNLCKQVPKDWVVRRSMTVINKPYKYKYVIQCDKKEQ